MTPAAISLPWCRSASRPTCSSFRRPKGYRTVGDLVRAAKDKPGSLTFSSVGIGTATHMSAERFRMSAGIDALHVPFKGGAEAMSEVIAGRVDFFFGPPALVAPHVKDGKLVALVANGSQRTAALPDTPTTAGSRFQQRRISHLVRPFRSGQDSARHRRSSAP